MGGASGLGEATVRALHERGATVTIADVNAEKGAALGSELGLEFVACDVREEGQVQAAVEKAAQADGGLRIAVCCAGTGWAQKVAGSKGPHPLLPFETIIQINLIGTFNALRFASFAMISNDALDDSERGVCVNTASIAAFEGQVGQIAYSASKGGVVGEPASTTWLLVRYATDTGTIVGWVNQQYIQLTRNQRKVDLTEVPTAKEITRGFIEGNATPVKPPAPKR